jgi:hypothetical protein
VGLSSADQGRAPIKHCHYLWMHCCTPRSPGPLALCCLTQKIIVKRACEHTREEKRTHQHQVCVHLMLSLGSTHDPARDLHFAFLHTTIQDTTGTTRARQSTHTTRESLRDHITRGTNNKANARNNHMKTNRSHEQDRPASTASQYVASPNHTMRIYTLES